MGNHRALNVRCTELADNCQNRPGATKVTPALSGVQLSHGAPAEIIVLATCYGDVPSLRAIQAGANGYLLKSALRAELPKAVIAVHNGDRYIPAQVTADLAEYIQSEALSAREAEVLFAMAAGNSNKHVAKIPGISEDTVKVHMRAVLSKLALVTVRMLLRSLSGAACSLPKPDQTCSSRAGEPPLQIVTPSRVL